MRILRFTEAGRVYKQIGINSRMDTLQAAVLLAKFRHLEEWTRAQKKAGGKIYDLLQD
jgi:dTDP-4-amino-4,6-dideoxygalactose transaminase